MFAGYKIVPWVFGPCSYNLRPVPSRIPYLPRTIAFGSCADNEIRPTILDQINADVFIFLGDIVYSDTLSSWIMWLTYNRLSCKPEFQRLVDRTPFVLATWDDHDYGMNDGGQEYPMKYESQKLFLDFWKVPHSNERRGHDGIYGTYEFFEGSMSVLVVMMDLRFFRSPLKKVNSTSSDYCASDNGTMLGSGQWDWLESTLKQSQSQIIIMASSTQFGAQAYGFETWRNFPHERDRLVALLHPKRTIFISGDLHIGEVSLTSEGFIDLTSSGLGKYDPPVLPNMYRIGQPIAEYNYGILDLEKKTGSVIGLSGASMTVPLILS